MSKMFLCESVCAVGHTGVWWQVVMLSWTDVTGHRLVLCQPRQTGATQPGTHQVHVVFSFSSVNIR